MPATIQQIQQALSLNSFDTANAHRKMMPDSRAVVRPEGVDGIARLGGVLLLLYRRNGSLHIVLTRRRDDLPSHAGQISFPGGRHEAPETLLETALRETEEEVGVAAADLQILGALTPIYIPPSDYKVYPFVAWASSGTPPVFRAAPREVAKIIEAPLPTLLDPASRVEETWKMGGKQVTVPYYAVQEHKVWGATAVMLSEFIERLRAILA